MSLSITEESHANKTILHLAGRIDSTNAQNAEAELFEYLGPEAQLALDFSDLEFISSAGLRIVLFMAKKMKAQKGGLSLYALQPVVNEVFEISGFSKILTIKETREEALAALD